MKTRYSHRKTGSVQTKGKRAVIIVDHKWGGLNRQSRAYRKTLGRKHFKTRKCLTYWGKRGLKVAHCNTTSLQGLRLRPMKRKLFLIDFRKRAVAHYGQQDLVDEEIRNRSTKQQLPVIVAPPKKTTRTKRNTVAPSHSMSLRKRK